jgi:hypothetical protein
MNGLGVATLFCATILVRVPDDIPAYPNTRQIQIGDELIIGGEYFRIAYFTTPDSVGTVAEHFFQAWKQAGLPTMVDGHPEDEMVVSAFYTREGLQRSIALKRLGDKTIGFAAVRDLWVRAHASPQEMFSPAEGVVWLQNVESRDGAARMYHRTALIENRLGTASDRIKDQLAAEGFSLAGEKWLAREGARQLSLEHIRDRQRVVTHLAEIELGATAIVQTCEGCVGNSAGTAHMGSRTGGGGAN